MRDRVRRIFRNVNDGLDLIVFLNSTEPHIDRSFFYATGLTDGLFEGCGAWLTPDGGCEITTSKLEEEAAKKSGLPLHVFQTRDESTARMKAALKGHRKVGINAAELTHAAFQRLQKLVPKPTRTVVVGSASEEQSRMHDTVARAQAAALAKMKPGSKGKSVDAAARDLIDRTKYKGRFIHGLGHSIGLAVHDGGALNPSSDLVLRPNMVFTDEPGVYVPGFGGVRIEDDVLITKKGPRYMSTAPRGLLEL